MRMLLLIIVAVAVSACATPYVERSEILVRTIGGVHFEATGVNSGRIIARGNPQTSHAQIADYVMRLAAAEAIRHGRAAFIVTNSVDASTVQYSADLGFSTYNNGTLASVYIPGGPVYQPGIDALVEFTDDITPEPGKYLASNWH